MSLAWLSNDDIFYGQCLAGGGLVARVAGCVLSSPSPVLGKMERVYSVQGARSVMLCTTRLTLLPTTSCAS